MGTPQTGPPHHPQVLEVALTPAAIPLHLLEQRRRHFLVRAGEIVGEPHLPAGAPEQRRLDEVVAQDLAAERLAPRQAGQAAAVGKDFPALVGVVVVSTTVVVITNLVLDFVLAALDPKLRTS